MAKQKSMKGKGTYVAYANENRVLTNKVRKLERHIKAFPNDQGAIDALKNIKAKGYTGRTAPSRVKARLAHLSGGNGPVSLNRLSGRLSSFGRIYQMLSSKAEAGLRESQYTEKNRAAEKTAKQQERAKQTKRRSKRKAEAKA